MNIFGRRVETDAPIQLRAELWPRRMKARLTLTQDGREQDLELSAPVVAALLAFLRPYLT